MKQNILLALIYEFFPDLENSQLYRHATPCRPNIVWLYRHPRDDAVLIFLQEANLLTLHIHSRSILLPFIAHHIYSNTSLTFLTLHPYVQRHVKRKLTFLHRGIFSF